MNKKMVKFLAALAVISCVGGMTIRNSAYAGEKNPIENAEVSESDEVIEAAIVNINAGAGTREDYIKLGISSEAITESNFYFVQVCVRTAREGKGSDLTKYEIVKASYDSIELYNKLFNTYK